MKINQAVILITVFLISAQIIIATTPTIYLTQPTSNLYGSGTADTIAMWNASNSLTNSRITQNSTSFYFNGNIFSNNDICTATQCLNNIINTNFDNVTKINFNLNPIINASEGDLYWDVEKNTLSLQGDEWSLELGQELYARIYNDKGYTLLDGHAVYPDGANGDFLTVDYADSSTEYSGVILGITNQDILSGETGMVSITGVIRHVNTSAWSPATTLYVDQNGLGHLTDIKPACSSCYAMTVGQVVTQGEDGSVFVRPRTAEVDPIWNSERKNYYNKTEIDLSLNLRAPIGGCPAGYYLQNLTNNETICTQLIIPSIGINGTGIEGYFPIWVNGLLTNQLGVSSMKTTIGENETYTTINNGSIYIDSTNGMVGINMVGTAQSHAQALEVQTQENQGIGNITIIGSDYDGYSTGVTTTNPLMPSFVDGTTLTVNEIGMTFYVFNVQNSTHFRVRGTTGGMNHTSSNWSWRQAPYVDVNGLSNTERGYSISSDGVWQWSLYVPDNSNDTKFCIQNRNAWFNGYTDAMCIEDNGDLTVYGDLSANSVDFPKYLGFKIIPTITDNGDGSINISNGTVNCYDGNVYTGTLRNVPIEAGRTGVGIIPALTSTFNTQQYILAVCNGTNAYWTVSTDSELTVGHAEYVLLANVLRNDDPYLGMVIHQQNMINYGYEKPEYAFQRVVDTQGIGVSQHSTLTITLNGLYVSTSGFDAWAGWTLYNIPATSATTIGVSLYQTGYDNMSQPIWGYSLSQPPTYNNTHYPNGTTLIPYTTEYYGIVDIWKGVENGDYMYLFPMNAEYSNFAQADAVSNLAPTPTPVPNNAVYFGRIIFQEGNTSNTAIKLKTNTFVTATPNQNHNSLSGLQGISPYYHLGATDYNNVINKEWNNINTTNNIQNLGFSTISQDWINDTASFYPLNDNPAGYLTNNTLPFDDDSAYNDTNAINNLSANTLKNSGTQTLNGTLAITGQTTIGGGFPNGGTTITNDGDIWMDGSLYLTGNISSVNITNIGINGSFNPALDAVFNSGYPNRWLGLYAVNFYGNLNASYITNAPWIITETDPIFTANNASIWNAINSKVNNSQTGNYAEMYNSSSGGTFTMTTQNTWYNLSGLVSGEVSGWTGVGTTGTLTCNSSGLYQVSLSLTGSVNNNDNLNFRIIVNGVLEDKSYMNQRFDTNLPQALSLTFFRRFNVGDNVTAQLRDTSRNGAIMTWANRNFVLLKVAS